MQLHNGSSSPIDRNVHNSFLNITELLINFIYLAITRYLSADSMSKRRDPKIKGESGENVRLEKYKVPSLPSITQDADIIVK